MLEEFLSKIEAAEKKATKGPWLAKWADRVVPTEDSDGSDSVCHIYRTDGKQEENRDFIALSRSAVPVLCRLVRIYEKYASANAFSPHVYADMRAELDAAKEAPDGR